MSSVNKMNKNNLIDLILLIMKTVTTKKLSANITNSEHFVNLTKIIRG